MALVAEMAGLKKREKSNQQLLAVLDQVHFLSRLTAGLGGWHSTLDCTCLTVGIALSLLRLSQGKGQRQSNNWVT